MYVQGLGGAEKQQGLHHIVTSEGWPAWWWLDPSTVAGRQSRKWGTRAAAPAQHAVCPTRASPRQTAKPGTRGGRTKATHITYPPLTGRAPTIDRLEDKEAAGSDLH